MIFANYVHSPIKKTILRSSFKLLDIMNFLAFLFFHKGIE